MEIDRVFWADNQWWEAASLWSGMKSKDLKSGIKQDLTHPLWNKPRGSSEEEEVEEEERWLLLPHDNKAYLFQQLGERAGPRRVTVELLIFMLAPPWGWQANSLVCVFIRVPGGQVELPR